MADDRIFEITAEDGRIIHGTKRIDILSGTAGDDIIYGFGRGDVVFGSGGRDYIDGGRGFDIVSYSQVTDPLHIALNGARDAFVYVEDPTQTTKLSAIHNAFIEDKKSIAQPLHGDNSLISTGHVLKDVLRRVEGVIGGHGDDVLVGDKRNNFLIGGPGRDILIGGDGADDFSYSIEDTFPSPPGSVDAILDFHPHEGDRIDFLGLSYDLEEPLTFAWATSSYTSSVPYSVFYKKGVAPGDNPLYGDPRFEDAEGNPLHKGEEGLSLMVDVDGDARADLMIAVWGVDSIKASDLIL